MESRPTYVCCRAGGPIVVDGVLDEPSWQRAEPIHLLRTDTGAAPRYPTTAKMLWDDRFFYVAFECIDPDIWGTVTEHDGPMYEEEVVEVFINANGDEISYIELEINPLNVSLDLFALNRNGKLRTLYDWECVGWLHAVVIDGDLNQRDRVDRSWAVEMAIPLANIETAPHIPPVHGDTWRVNLYRIDRAADGDEYSAWSPTWATSYHIPSCFGRVVFSAEPVSPLPHSP